MPREVHRAHVGRCALHYPVQLWRGIDARCSYLGFLDTAFFAGCGDKDTGGAEFRRPG